jgi:hypothetical protein
MGILLNSGKVHSWDFTPYPFPLTYQNPLLGYCLD